MSKLYICAHLYFTDYLHSGFLFLQHRVDIAIIRAINPDAQVNDTRVRLKPFPRPPYVHDEWGPAMRGYMGFIVWLLALFYILDIATKMVEEKQANIEVFSMFYSSCIFNTCNNNTDDSNCPTFSPKCRSHN